MSDLLICIRCHKYPDFVADTVDSVKKLSTFDNDIMLAVDNENIGKASNTIKEKYPGVGIYISDELCGWGAGMYKLFVDSLKWALDRYDFKHFVCIDYDTIFTRVGADKMIIDNIESNTGLLGAVQHPSSHWVKLLNKEMDTLEAYLNIPDNYREGRAVLGALMVLTQNAIREFRMRDYFDEPYRSVLGLNLSDDVWISLLTRTTGLDIKDLKSYDPEHTKKNKNKQVAVTWKLPTPKEKVIENGAFIFHPTKYRSGGKTLDRDERSTEENVRKWFRDRRNK